MHIVIRDENRNVRSAEIDTACELVTIGSNPECKVYLPDIRVADQHFRLVRKDDRTWWLERCVIAEDSPAVYTRVYVNALEATETMQVKQSDEIIIARFTLGVFVDDSSATAPRAAILEEATRIREHPLPAGSLVRSERRVEMRLPPGEADALAAFGFRIHECGDLASMMNTAIRDVARRFNAHQVWLGTRRHGYGRLEFVETRYSDGRTSGEPPRLETFEYRCLERNQCICCLQAEAPAIESAMCIPLFGQHATLGMLYVDNEADAVPYGEQDLDVLTMMGAAVARQFELIVREQVKLQEAIAAGEWSFIRELQSCMDPTNAPQWDGLQIAVYCKPGLDSAGDLYDIMRLPNGLASFMCGHVSGSPTVAALAMAEVRASFRFAGLHADPPHVLMQAMNWLLYDPKKPASLSFFGVVMNPATGAMQFAGAGNPGAVVIDHRGAVRSLVTPSVPAVGQQRDYKYASNAGRLQAGETIVLYTPGATSVIDASGEALGEQRLLEAASDSFGQSASTALDELLSDLKAYYGAGRQPDDITFMVLHRE